MNYYKLSDGMVIRFEFFGGLMVSTNESNEYELDLPNTIFLKSIDNGFSKEESLKIVESLINNEFEIDIEDFLSENILIPVSNTKRKVSKHDFIEKIKKEINEVSNIKHLSFPIQVSLYLDSTCQLNCKFCFFSEKRKIFKETYDVEKWLELIKKLKEYNIIYLSILGGEPTLYKDIDKILTLIDELKIKTTITTNGVNIKKSTFDIICRSKYITPTISLQSIDDDTNKYLMGVESSKIIKTIKHFIENKKVPRINTVITNQTKQELCNLIDFCVENKISDFYIDVYMTSKNIENLKTHTFKEYREIKEELDNYINEKKYKDKIFFQLQGCLLYSAFYDIDEGNIETEYEKIKYGCEAGNTKIEIMPNGDVYPCVMFSQKDFKYDNVFKKNIKDIWFKSKNIKELRNRKCLDKRCSKCRFNDFCNGGCPALVIKEEKNINEYADERCHIIKEKEYEKF